MTQSKISFIINLHYAFLISLNRLGSYDTINFLSCCVQEKHSWDLIYTISCWNGWNLINIHCQEYDVFMLVCQFIYLRMDYPAWATPFCPEEYDTWTSSAYNFIVLLEAADAYWTNMIVCI